MPKRLPPEEVQRRASWSRDCETCGKPFGWSKNGDRAKYCSRECGGRAIGKTSRGTDARFTYTCAQCGSPFKSFYKDRKYCSRVCAGKGRMGLPLSSRRGRGRADANQPAIVAAMLKVGASVLDTSKLGGGFPDLVVGFRSQNFLLEVKNPENAYGRRGLNANQLAWNANWNGRRMIAVCSIDEALRAIGVIA